MPVPDGTLLQIEKDLPRTLSRGKIMVPGSPLWESTKRVLRAYAARDAAVGYVQGMNFSAAFLLQAGVPEEPAFWCLVALVERVVRGYFSEGMAAAKLDARVLLALLYSHLPALALHLAELGSAAGDEHLVTSVMSSQWLMTLFVTALPTRACFCVWDAVCAAGGRAPLFAAGLALLDDAQAAVLRCGEMGEAVELLQGLGLGGGYESPQQVASFAASVGRYAALLPAPALAAACARELGEGGAEAGVSSFLSPSQSKGLYAPTTDASVLTAGTSSAGLFAVASGLPPEEADGGLQEELAAVACLDAAPAPKAGSPSFGGGGGATLSADDVLRLSSALAVVDGALRERAPWMRPGVRDFVRAAVLRPLGALSGARLGRARAEWESQHGAFASVADGVLSSHGLASLDTSRRSYIDWWDHGAGEAACRAADQLADRLARMRRTWRQLCAAVAAEGGEPPPASSPPAEGDAPPAGPPSFAPHPHTSLRVCDASVSSAVSSAAAHCAAAEAALRAATRRRCDAAAADLPLLDSNYAAAVGYLEGRSASTRAGCSRWMATWHEHRVASASSAVASLRAASAAAASALEAEDVAASVPRSPPMREATPCSEVCVSGYMAEGERLGAASQLLVGAQQALQRRHDRLEAEAKLVRAVRARAAHRLATDAARAEALKRAHARCAEQLTALAADTAQHGVDAVLASLRKLHATALRILEETLRETARFLTTAQAALAMSHGACFTRKGAAGARCRCEHPLTGLLPHSHTHRSLLRGHGAAERRDGGHAAGGARAGGAAHARSRGAQPRDRGGAPHRHLGGGHAQQGAERHRGARGARSKTKSGRWLTRAVSGGGFWRGAARRGSPRGCRAARPA